MGEAVTITTSDGEQLEGELAGGEGASLAEVITHPHPLMGGDMHTPVPGGFFRALGSKPVAALRFNFRGVGRSTGTHDKGGAEQLDVQAAVDHVAAVAGDVPIVLAGWSFGADVSLTVDDDRVAGWFLAAPPLKVVDPETMAASSAEATKVLAIGEHDQFNSPADAKATTASWTNTEIRTIAGADHFFGPALPTLIADFEAFIDHL